MIVEAPEELGLNGEGKIADLIKKESSVLGKLEEAHLRLVPGAGASPLLAAEELGLEEGLRQGGRMAGMEAPVTWFGSNPIILVACSLRKCTRPAGSVAMTPWLMTSMIRGR